MKAFASYSAPLFRPSSSRKAAMNGSTLFHFEELSMSPETYSSRLSALPKEHPPKSYVVTCFWNDKRQGETYVRATSKARAKVAGAYWFSLGGRNKVSRTEARPMTARDLM